MQTDQTSSSLSLVSLKCFLLLISVFMGILVAIFFLAGCAQEPVTTDILVPVDFSNAPSHMMVTSFQTDKIVVRIKGRPREIKELAAQDIHYPADLYTDLEFDPAGASQSIQSGNYVLPINKGRIPIDPDMILDISPSCLRVHLEKRISKTLPVRASYTGQPAHGHIFMEAACEPSTVKVTGPIALVNALTEIQTKPICLDQARASFQKKVPPNMAQPHLIKVTPDMILVTVPIQDKRVIRQIKALPVQVLSDEHKGSISPDSISITVKGPFSHVESKDMDKQIYAYIDIRDLAPGVYARHVTINIPVEMAMIQAEPRVFTVTIPEPGKRHSNH